MIRYDQLECAWIGNKSSNLSVKARKTMASDPQQSAESYDSLTHKQGATLAKGKAPNPCNHPASCHMRYGVIR